MKRQNLSAVLCAALLFAGVAPARADDPVPRLSFPVECEPGATCMVQNYFDHDPGAGVQDYHCGFLSYDGHDGTDIRLVDLAAMRRGFRVLAAADGTVRAIRDGMSDINLRDAGEDAIRGKEAGNSVVIDHGGGWQTQYSHLRKGSVLVRRGDAVTRGQALGLIGLSGWTEFPHLHLTVRYRGRKLDPFVGPGAHGQCGLGDTPMWDETARAALKYVSSGILDAGFAGTVPTAGQLKTAAAPLPGATAPALVFWVRAYGMQTGDDEHLRIVAPDGRLFAESRRKIPANKAEWLTFTGRKRRDAPWPAGTYRGEYTLTRAGSDGPQKVIAFVRELQISR